MIWEKGDTDILFQKKRAMKKNIILLLAVLSILVTGCKNEEISPPHLLPTPAPPTKEEQVAMKVGKIRDIFELKRNETYPLILEEDSYTLTIKEVQDSLYADCSVTYFEGGVPETLRIYVILTLTGPTTQTVKVQTPKCGGDSYRDDKPNLEDAWDQLKSIRITDESDYRDYFYRYYDHGTVIPVKNTFYKLYIAKSDLDTYLSNGAKKVGNYRFIFILTKIEDTL